MIEKQAFVALDPIAATDKKQRAQAIRRDRHAHGTLPDVDAVVAGGAGSDTQVSACGSR
jgi:hypothetical protein